MADRFLHLTGKDRREALAVAAAASGRPMHLLDKDVWVVWVLEVLFRAPFSKDLVFKGGTSLSKAYNVIRRFSEDVDLTYDIRALVPDLVGPGDDPSPPNRSQQNRWTKEIRNRLPAWIGDQVVPVIAGALSAQGMSAQLVAETEKVLIEYEPLATGSGYSRLVVMLEFGARSTGEPCERRPVHCDAADHLPDVVFPDANPRVMRPERTFWEKATAIHVFCADGQFRSGERFSRHWHDITRLDKAGFVDAAIAHRAVGRAVAKHKGMFFVEKDSQGLSIDYEAAVSGALRLVPTDEALESLSDDYRRMVDDGLLVEEAEPFQELLDHCRRIQDRVNRARVAMA
jgi:hypothetical protein